MSTPQAQEVIVSHEEFQKNCNEFEGALQTLVHKYGNLIPAEIMYTQLSFWAAVNMRNLLNTAQTVPVGTTVN